MPYTFSVAREFRIRPASERDAPALNRLVNSAYRGESSRAGWTTEAHLLDGQRTDEDWLRDIIATPDQVILIHEQDGAPTACVLLERHGSECYLGMLTVKPTAQATGIGRQLLDAAERWAVDTWSTRGVYMSVLIQRPELIAWYQRRGYHRTGEQKPFPYGDERFGLPRTPDLAFAVLRKIVGLVLLVALLGGRADAQQPEPKHPGPATSSPATVAPPAWNRVVKLADGRTFVTDGGLVIDAAVAKPATLPTIVVAADSVGARTIAGYFTAPHQLEFGLSDLRPGSMSNTFVAPGGIGLNGNYVRFLRNALPTGATRLHGNGPRDPVVVTANGESVAVLMPIVLP